MSNNPAASSTHHLPGDLSVDQPLALKAAAANLQAEFADMFGGETIEGKSGDCKPIVLFLCTHNAGRSQMAMGFFNELAGDGAVAWSGGSEPGNEVNPAAVQAMAERGIDISGEYPKPWTDEIVQAADVVVTMGCGDACPIFPGRRYEEWVLDDPAGQNTEAVRPIRDDIERRVRRLLADLGVPDRHSSTVPAPTSNRVLH
jgi:arsenate reductase (thioredoxin)